MRSINNRELSLVAGGTLNNDAGLNSSGAFNGIDNGVYYTAPQPTITNNWGSGRVESINFMTFVGAIGAIGALAWKSVIDEIARE